MSNDQAEPSTLALELFDELVDLPRDQRAPSLLGRCDNVELRREVQSLLDAHDDAGGFFSEPASRFARQDDGPQRAGASDEFASGSRIGHYELLETLGEGGFARVYRARQHHPVRRDVALKIIKLGMDTRQVIARFELERQALAMMDHPGIAAVYDAGVTDGGRPYFVMELVRGQRINRWCDERDLGVRQRVRLFVDVCRAVHHAHTKGILHRDLKPSNILVTEVDGHALPKVIDFGIAKATQERLTDATQLTQERQFLGTPQYMSPEQAISGGADVDTRGDIYSLGAVLYELLTGGSPWDDPAGAPSSQFEQFQRLTGDADAPRPSTRVADPSRRRELRGELDWVIGKCLERDRARRYDSAAALADELEALLENRPIGAAPPTLSYRAAKFARRNTTAVIATLAVALALIVGSIASLTQAVRAMRAERLAEARLAEVQAVNDFLTQDVIAAANPLVAQANRDMTVREALDNAARAVAGKFKDHPLNEAAVREMIAWSYRSLGQLDQALPHADAALEQRRRLLGEDHAETLRALGVRAAILRSMQRNAEAEALFKELLDRCRRVLGEDDPQTVNALSNYASAVMVQGRWADAEPLARRAAAEARRALGLDHTKTVVAMCEHARVLLKLGRAAEAEPIIAEAHALSLRLRGPDYPDTISAMALRATILKDLGRYAEAEPLVLEALRRRRAVYGDDSHAVLSTLQEYGVLLAAMGRRDEALVVMKDLLEASRRVRGPDHPLAITDLNNYAVTLQGAGRAAEAEPMLAEVLERRRRVQGQDHPETINAQATYGLVLQRLGRAAEAEPLLRDAVAQSRRVLGDEHWRTLLAMSFHADVLMELDRPAEAEPLCAELSERLDNPGVTPSNAAYYAAQQGQCLAQLGRYTQAEAPLRDACERYRKLGQDDGNRARKVLAALADVCDRTGRPDEAAALRAQLAAMTMPSTQPTTRP